MFEFSIILLLTLIILEIVLGVDNLVFIAILTDKLPPQKRDKARVIGLSLALVMRIFLLCLASWLVSLQSALFTVAGHPFSMHDLVMLAGGIFLIYKATVELHERMEGIPVGEHENRGHATLWGVIIQVVALDAVFSIDSVIMAVGLAKEHLFIMISAVVVAMGAMMFASKPLTNFVNQHPTVVVLCLSFLLLIGTSLVAEGFGIHLDKKYIYAAIGFSIMIEIFNQIAQRNFLKYQARIPLRQRTANAILNMVGLQPSPFTTQVHQNNTEKSHTKSAFVSEEQMMIRGTLAFADRSIKTIMTPRMEISWIDSEEPVDEIRRFILQTPHNMFPVCRESLDDVIGVVDAKDLLDALAHGEDIEKLAKANPPTLVPESVDTLKLLDILRESSRRLVLITDEFGEIQGLITPLDVLEAIAGDFPDEDETPDIVKRGEGWLARGSATLDQLERALGSLNFINPDEEYATLAGLLLSEYGRIPQEGVVIDIGAYRFTILKMDKHRIDQVAIKRIAVSPQKN